uniref:hypothetical protein n=1 Tax=Crenothrix polyspora TaxID=360316 RepID=UPI0015C5C6FD|nr:hypothetical protein [Crenothrix polyspora]
MLVTAAINLGLLTALFFIVGMIKPKWALFFMDKPNRFIILVVSTVLVMVSFTMFGEGNRQGIKPNQWTKVPTTDVANAPAAPSVIVPVPVPDVKDDIPAPATTPVPAPVATPASASVPSVTTTTPAPTAVPATPAPQTPAKN